MIRLLLPDGSTRNIAPAPGRTLAQAIFLAGLWDGVALCSGLGRCGLCRVRFLRDAPEARAEELRRLGAAAAAQGWRLSCLHPAEECSVELPEPRRAAASLRRRGTKSSIRPNRPVQPLNLALNLAVDLGTTTIQWNAFIKSGEAAEATGAAEVAAGRALNPQMGLGGEVMSRLAFALQPGGAEILRRLVLDRLRGILAAGGPADRLCIAGNSAMTYLLLGLDVSGLARAPYRLGYAGGDTRPLAADLPEARIPPLLAPFVGGDVSAGLAALRFGPAGPPEYPYLLADLGTNGEFALALSETEYLLASVPMGPALEGVGLRHGGVAAPGAVRAYGLTPAGLAPEYVDRPPLPGEAPGITGVGYLSLAAALRRAGVLDETGRFVVPATPFGRKLAAGLDSSAGEAALPLPGGLALPASDVEEIVKVKAAFNLALSRLLAESGLEPADLRAVYLAGAMGEHADVRDLAALGFLPEAATGRVRGVGNASLAGARLLLRSEAAWDWARALPEGCRTIDLAGNPRFGAMYMERMVLRHVP